VAQGKLVYQLKVTLRGIRPPIWRRIQVLSDIALSRLHTILQVVMGWTDSHLHQFLASGTYYGTPDPELGIERQNERRVRLNEVLRRPKDRMEYEYDFGDGWEHDIVLERTMSPVPKGRYPIVVAGKRACPPDDVGGIGGYYDFLDAIKDPKHPDHHDMMEWCGGSFDPEAFDVQEINRLFHGGWGPAKPNV
jgi:hypothetical protein